MSWCIEQTCETLVGREVILLPTEEINSFLLGIVSCNPWFLGDNLMETSVERSNKGGRFSYPSIIWGLGVALIVIIMLSFFLGRYPITPSELFGVLFSKIFPLNQFWLDQMETIVFNVRLPRIMLACLVGCCLSAAGAMTTEKIIRQRLAWSLCLGLCLLTAGLGLFWFSGSERNGDAGGLAVTVILIALGLLLLIPAKIYIILRLMGSRHDPNR